MCHAKAIQKMTHKVHNSVENDYKLIISDIRCVIFDIFSTLILLWQNQTLILRVCLKSKVFQNNNNNNTRISPQGKRYF